MGIAFGVIATVFAIGAIVDAPRTDDARAAGIACVMAIAFLGASVAVLLLG